MSAALPISTVTRAYRVVTRGRMRGTEVDRWDAVCGCGRSRLSAPAARYSAERTLAEAFSGCVTCTPEVPE